MLLQVFRVRFPVRRCSPTSPPVPHHPGIAQVDELVSANARPAVLCRPAATAVPDEQPERHGLDSPRAPWRRVADAVSTSTAVLFTCHQVDRGVKPVAEGRPSVLYHRLLPTRPANRTGQVGHADVSAEQVRLPGPSTVGAGRCRGDRRSWSSEPSERSGTTGPAAECEADPKHYCGRCRSATPPHAGPSWPEGLEDWVVGPGRAKAVEDQRLSVGHEPIRCQRCRATILGSRWWNKARLVAVIGGRLGVCRHRIPLLSARPCQRG